MTEQFSDMTQRRRLHLLRREIADGMRERYERMTVHAFGAECVDGRVAKDLGDEYGSGYSAFFKLYCVVHTAQRTGTSTSYGSDGDVDSFRKRIQLLCRCRP